LPILEEINRTPVSPQLLGDAQRGGEGIDLTINDGSGLSSRLSGEVLVSAVSVFEFIIPYVRYRTDIHATPVFNLQSEGASRVPVQKQETNPSMDWGVFGPQDVTNMRTGLDRAWNCLAPERRTPEAMDILAAVIVHWATLGERDPIQLSSHALQAAIREAPHGAL
jgi:hypothetical protein